MISQLLLFCNYFEFTYIFLRRHTGPKVFQLYVWKDRGLVQDVIKKAKAGGFNALALTADFTRYGNRERDVRNGISCIPILCLELCFA